MSYLRMMVYFGFPYPGQAYRYGGRSLRSSTISRIRRWTCGLTHSDQGEKGGVVVFSVCGMVGLLNRIRDGLGDEEGVKIGEAYVWIAVE